MSSQSDGLIPVRLYKDIDGDNQGVFCLLKSNGNEYTEVQIYPPRDHKRKNDELKEDFNLL